MPLVSVIMPSYNHERFVSEAIESILNQTLDDLELIIIDDASKDNSRRIIEDFSKKDNRIKTIFHERNMGIARTVNDGIEAATGKFIAFTASDDLWVKDKLEKQLKILEQKENAVLWSEVEIIDAQGKSTGETITKTFSASDKKKSGHIFEDILRADFIYVCGLGRILKRANLGNIRFNEALKYFNDLQFDVDLAQKYEYYFVPEILAKYRKHGTNTTARDIEQIQKEGTVFYKDILERYRQVISNETKTRIYLNMARKYGELGDKAQASEALHFAKFLLKGQNKETSSETIALTYLNLASTYLTLGNRAQAVVCLYGGIKANPFLLPRLLFISAPKYLFNSTRNLKRARK